MANFVNESSDIEAIKILYNRGCRISNYNNLHAKIYVFDSLKALITSSNLTISGMLLNYEYGTLLTNQKNLLKKINIDLKELLNDCEKPITINDIKAIEPNIASFKNNRITTSTNNNLIIEIKSYEKLLKNRIGWNKDVLLCITKLQNDSFTLTEMYNLVNNLRKLHPNNYFVKEKIRQVLQMLAHEGLIGFNDQVITLSFSSYRPLIVEDKYFKSDKIVIGSKYAQ